MCIYIIYVQLYVYVHVHTYVMFEATLQLQYFVCSRFKLWHLYIIISLEVRMYTMYRCIRTYIYTLYESTCSYSMYLEPLFSTVEVNS